MCSIVVQFVQQLGLTPEELHMMGGVEPRENDRFVLEVELVGVEDRKFSTEHFPIAEHLTGKAPLRLKNKVRVVGGLVVQMKFESIQRAKQKEIFTTGDA